MLEIKDLHVNYGAVHALNGVSMTVKDGEIVSLIGANGAGKTTTLRTITGLEKAASGSIVFDGHDLRKTLVGKLDDPDAYGAERVAVYGVSYDEQVLMDWEAGKAGSMTISFQATNVEYLDKVEA